jgi:hypothetical protein
MCKAGTHQVAHDTEFVERGLPVEEHHITINQVALDDASGAQITRRLPC